MQVGGGGGGERERGEDRQRESSCLCVYVYVNRLNKCNLEVNSKTGVNSAACVRLNNENQVSQSVYF